MKGGSMHKMRHIKLLIAIFALICLTFAFWTVEKAEIFGNFFPPMQPPDKLPIFPLRSFPEAFSDVQHESAGGNILLVTSRDVHHDSSDEQISLPTFTDMQHESYGKNMPAPSFSDKKHVSASESIPSGGKFIDSSRQMLSPLEIAKSSMSSSGKERDAKNVNNALSQSRDCNYAKGKWVPDNRRPLYSGLGCQQWLSSMWACRLLRRTDFSYESFRWQPQDCEMPEFSGLEFLHRMRHKTVAFVGDSLGRQQFQSLMCMVSNGAPDPVEDIGEEYGLIQAAGAIRPDGWAYRFTYSNTTILFYWSATLCAVKPLNSSDRATYYALHLDQPVAFLSENLHRFDVLVLNTGHHWNRGKFQGNRWEMYVGGMPNTDRKLAQMGNAKVLAIRSVVKWIDSQLPQNPRLKAFLRTISPRHFMHGDWNTGGTCDNTVPLTHGSEVVQDNSSDPVAEDAVRGTKVELLDITALSQLRDEGHISKYFSKTLDGGRDCLHWCLPGIPDTWNEILCVQLQSHR